VLDPGAPGRERLEERRLLGRWFVEARKDDLDGRGEAPRNDQRAHGVRQSSLIDGADALDASLVVGGPPGEHPGVLRQRIVAQPISDPPLMGERPGFGGELRGAGGRCQRHVACLDHAFPQRAFLRRREQRARNGERGIVLRDVMQACDVGAERQHTRRLPHLASLLDLPAIELPVHVAREAAARRDDDRFGGSAGEAFKKGSAGHGRLDDSNGL
jgi:hypothetical protein